MTNWGLTIATNSDTAQINGSVAADSIIITSTNPTDGSWNFNGDIVNFTGVTGFNLYGGGGADTITGGDGDDTIEGGADGDILNGGANGMGGDTLSYASSGAGVYIDLDLNFAGDNVGGISDANGDTISNFENIIGSDYDDFLVGDGMVNTIHGGAGADFPQGFGGADQHYGEAGNDTLALNSDYDASGILFDGGADNDTLLFLDFAGLGVDRRDDYIVDVEALRFFAAGKIVNDLQINGSQLATFTTVTRDALAEDVTINVTMDTPSLDLSGVAFTGFTEPGDKIVITGTGDAETITGSSINDIIEGGAGADILNGGANGAGGDTVSFANMSGASGVTVDMGVTTAQTVGGDGDTISNFENIIGSVFADTIAASSAGGTIDGAGGDDTIILRGTGGTAPTAIHGGTDMDTIQFGIGVTGSTSHDLTMTSISSIEVLDFFDPGENQTQDVFLLASQIGGMGISATAAVDFDPYCDTAETIHIDLGMLNALDLSGWMFTQAAGVVTNTNSTIAITGTSTGDVIVGSNIIDVINGGFGVDDISGGGGADTINGNQGNDTINGGAGNDILYGGEGQGTDTIHGGDDDDTIYGGASADTVSGDGGNDFVYGGGQADLVYGGSGMDTVDGGSGNDYVSGGSGNDMVYGGNGTDQLFGNKDDDLLVGGEGNDVMSGGDDSYIFQFNVGDIGDDTILDFTEDFDMLEFTGAITAGDITIASAGVGGTSTLITVVGYGMTIWPDGVDSSTISTGDDMTFIGF